MVYVAVARMALVKAMRWIASMAPRMERPALHATQEGAGDCHVDTLMSVLMLGRVPLAMLP